MQVIYLMVKWDSEQATQSIAMLQNSDLFITRAITLLIQMSKCINNISGLRFSLIRLYRLKGLILKDLITP